MPYFSSVSVIIVVLLFGCSAEGGDDCVGTDLGADNCLVFETSKISEVRRSKIEGETERVLNAVNSVMPTGSLQITVRTDLSFVIPELGLGGFNPSADEVRMFVDPDSPLLDASLENEWFRTLAHEIHHARRRRSVGYGRTLLQAMITEGLADHFAVEISGDEPPIWSLALQGDTLTGWIDRSRAQWGDPAYNHNRWFFGTEPDVPRWTGYAIGFELVRRHLEDNPGRSASDLVDEPAGTFIPEGGKF